MKNPVLHVPHSKDEILHRFQKLLRGHAFVCLCVLETLISCNVCVSVCLLKVPSLRTQNCMDWRLLIKEQIAKITKLRILFLFCKFIEKKNNNVLIFGVLDTQAFSPRPTNMSVHSLFRSNMFAFLVVEVLRLWLLARAR